MKAIFYTNAKTPEELKAEFVKELREKVERERNLAKAERTARDRNMRLRIAKEFEFFADHWEQVHIGRPE